MPSPNPSTHAPASSRIFGQSLGRVRKLKGFLKSHHVPDGHHDAAQAFVRKVGQADVKAAADRLYIDIRELFGYKRKQFDYTCEDGFALIKTPDFDLQIHVDQCTEDPKNYRLITEITALHNEAIANDVRFHACFTHHCEQLVVDFPSPINVEDKIDAIEEIDALANCLEYQPDGSRFELKLIDLELLIEVSESQMTFRLLTLRNLGKLLNHSQKAFDILTEAGLYAKLAD